jgi:hypothetical protein
MHGAQLLGLVGYYHRSIRDYGVIATLLTKLLCKGAFKWTDEAEQAPRTTNGFDKGTGPTVVDIRSHVHHLVQRVRVRVQCCASPGHGSLVPLNNCSPAKVKLKIMDDFMAFFNCQIAPWHAKLVAYEREFIGLVQEMRHWRSYLWGRPFLVRTDHYSLKFLLDQRLSHHP